MHLIIQFSLLMSPRLLSKNLEIKICKTILPVVLHGVSNMISHVKGSTQTKTIIERDPKVNYKVI
jgi:hypothetical protein